MSNFIVLDTNIIIDLINGTESVREAYKIYEAIEQYDARIGLTILSFYEIVKKVNDDSKLYDINHFLANKIDFILCDRRIKGCYIVNPKKWDSPKMLFNYSGFRRLVETIKTSVKEFYIEQITCIVISIIGFTFLVKGITGQISTNYFDAFASASEKQEMLTLRNNIVKAAVKAGLNNDDLYDKEKSKSLIENIIANSVLALSNFALSFSTIKVTNKDVSNVIQSKAFNRVKSIFDLRTSETFVDSFFKHLNRKSEDGVMLRGLNLLFNKYIFGRKLSINDFIDLSNIESVDDSLKGNNCYYYTREKFWNEQFADAFAKDLENIYKCRIIKL